MENIFAGKTVLVTGGCGSIGSEIARQLLGHGPAEVRIFDHSEDAHFRFAQKLPQPVFTHVIGDIRDRERVSSAMEGVDIVFHAAALKHVPYCEYNPYEAVATNVIGTKNVVDAALAHHVKIFVGISTDKAVNPINTMGATKLLGEKIITNAPIGKNTTRFCCVRFGNVLASAGSVIPIFAQQLSSGNTVTITHPEMTRFFMSMEDAVTLVLRAARHVSNGQIFILKMPALRIVDLATVVIEELAPKYGKKPSDITIQYIGVRPGEKLHEALVSAEEAAYMEELPDMFVLHNSTLAQRAGHHAPNPGQAHLEDYNSATVPAMSIPEIRKTLRDKRIL